MIGRRLAAELPLKLGLSLGLAVLFCVPYFALQRAPFFPVRTLPLTWIDRAIAFSPGWVWVYQSVYLLIALVPWMATRRDVLLRYARGFVLLSSIGFAFFLIVPVAGPRPAGVSATGMFALLVSYDTPLNAFPSLHCGLAAYTALLAAEISGGGLPSRWRQAPLAALFIWVLLIGYATLATKQHYAVDIPAGILLAWLCHRRVWAVPAPVPQTAINPSVMRSHSDADAVPNALRLPARADLRLRAGRAGRRPGAGRPAARRPPADHDGAGT